MGNLKQNKQPDKGMSEFDKAFAAAKKAGNKTFTFEGQEFTTELASQDVASQEGNPSWLQMALRTVGGLGPQILKKYPEVTERNEIVRAAERLGPAKPLLRYPEQVVGGAANLAKFLYTEGEPLPTLQASEEMRRRKGGMRKKKSGGMKKMYKSGGFLSEPSVHDLDKD